jgi:hypothetical protein
MNLRVMRMGWIPEMLYTYADNMEIVLSEPIRNCFKEEMNFTYIFPSEKLLRRKIRRKAKSPRTKKRMLLPQRVHPNDKETQLLT